MNSQPYVVIMMNFFEVVYNAGVILNIFFYGQDGKIIFAICTPLKVNFRRVIDRMERDRNPVERRISDIEIHVDGIDREFFTHPTCTVRRWG